MTALAMAVGIPPTAFAIEEGSALHQQMAVAVIGRLLSSAIFSLAIGPAAYELVGRLKWLVQRLLTGVATRRSEELAYSAACLRPAE